MRFQRTICFPGPIFEVYHLATFDGIFNHKFSVVEKYVLKLLEFALSGLTIFFFFTGWSA